MDIWWTQQQAGLIGGGIGIIGAVFGTVAGCTSPLVNRGKGKPFVLGMLGSLAALGIVLLIPLVVALFMHQPYHVWYPLALGGFLFTLLGTLLFFVVRKRYQHAEARKLEAEQLRRG